MRFLSTCFLLFLISCNGSGDTNEPKDVTKSRHDEAFNQSVRNSLDAYYALTEAFVNYDSVNIPKLAADLQQKISLLKPDEEDSTTANYIARSQRHAAFITEDHILDEKRRSLHALSESMFNYLEAVKYDKEKLYFQECPMAFNDTESGYWLSGADSIRNPYLGLYHPKYGKGMLKCGDNKSVINHIDSE